jgi:acyl-CoA dehydrogenase
MPFSEMVIESFHMGLADGPTEVHKVTLARQVLSEYTPTDGLFPSRHVPALRAAALDRYRDVIERHVAQL